MQPCGGLDFRELRRTPAGAGVVVWGNADAALHAAADAVARAVAAVTGGRVEPA